MGSPKLESAIAFATEKHRGQYRDGEAPLPYICHPFDVLANLRYVGEVTDEDLWCAAILHDVVEETDATLADVEAQCGSRVAELVQELTRVEPGQDEIQGMDKEQIWELRSKMLLEEIEKMSSAAQMVKLSDRLSNLQEAERTKPEKKLKRYNRQTAKILKIIPKSVNPGLWAAVKSLHDRIGE
ncbi:MAG TPA: HD domain-containing protein [Fimbriimonadaceae bacterium]|nr:HD domain-containing protein [Fimbriimonadaceae bacterium]